MANEWNASHPIDHTKIGDIPGEIRKLKDSTKDQLSHEHEAPVDGDATGSEHSSGSAVAFEGTSTPTARPGGTALADNAIDRGRLWLDDNSDPPLLKRWTGAAFTEAVQALGGFSPAAYVGGESITFPNGFILKFGYVASIAASGTETVTFDTAFPTNVVAALGCVEHTAVLGGNTNIYVSTLIKASLKLINDNEDNSQAVGAYWVAFGY